MENYRNKVAIVTGSSSGIGAALAKELTRRGCVVIGLARRTQKLLDLSEEIRKNRESYEGTFHPLECDITNEKQLEEIFSKIQENYGIPWILVNNAGKLISDKSPLELDGASFDTMVNTNVKGLFVATKLAMKLMRDNSVTGHILNVNSRVGYYLTANSNHALYSGSKHMARIFAEGIRDLVAENKWNIKISNICPGVVRTEMTVGLPEHEHLLPMMLSTDDVVKACISILDTPPNVLISELIIMPVHQMRNKIPMKP